MKTLNAILGALLLALFYSAEAGAAEPKKVRLAYVGWEVGAAVSYVGIDGGIFKQNGLEVEEVFVRDPLSGGVQSLIGADLMVGFGNPLALIHPLLMGADLVSIASHVSVQPYGMAVAPNIGKMGDLKGKRVCVSELGGRSDLILRVMLRRAGMDPVKDVEVVGAGLAPNRLLALSKDLIQGAPVNEQFAAEAKKIGIKIIEVKDIPAFTSMVLTTRSFIKRDEDAIRRFVKGYTEAIHFYLTRRADSLAIIRKYFSGSNPAALESMYESFAAELRPLPQPDREAAQALIDSAALADPKAKDLKPEILFDSHFLDELKSNGFIEKLYAEKVSL